MTNNEAQRAQWNNDERIKGWRTIEPSNAPVNAALFAALELQPGDAVLDIGCGGGPTSIEAALAVGESGHVTGFDISEPMIALARERATEASLANTTFAVGDAQADTPPGGPFDVAMSRFGVMFFANPAAAFANIRKQLRTGGRLVFACWQGPSKNRWFPTEVMMKYSSAPPRPAGSPPAPGPFAFGDPAYVTNILEEAGFKDIAFAPHGYEWRSPAGANSHAMMLDSLNLDAEQRALAAADMNTLEASMIVDGEVREERNYWIVTASS